MKTLRIVLMSLAVVIAVGAAFATTVKKTALISPYGQHPSGGGCVSASLVNPGTGITCDVLNPGQVCQVQVTYMGNTQTVTAYDGAGNCGDANFDLRKSQ